METPVSESYIGNEDDYEPNRILAAWCKAISSLYMYNSAINTHLNYHSMKSSYIGQCPVEALVQLAVTIYTELTKLEQDWDQLSKANLRGNRQSFERMATHTIILNRLNRQAKIKLKLAELPAC